MKLSMKRPVYCPDKKGCKTLLQYRQGNIPRLCTGRLLQPQITPNEQMDTHRICFPGSVTYDETTNKMRWRRKVKQVSGIVLNRDDLSFWHGLLSMLEADMNINGEEAQQ